MSQAGWIRILRGAVNSRWFADDLVHRLAKNASVLLSGNIIAAILSFITLALTARVLGVEKFGALVMVTAYVQIVSGMINFQSWQAVIKFGSAIMNPEMKERFKALIKFGFLLDMSAALISAVVAVLATLVVSEWMNWSAEVTNAAALYSFTIIFHVSGTPLAILRLFNRFDRVAHQVVMAAAVKLFGVSLATSMGFGFWGVLGVWAISDIIGRLILVYFAYRQLVTKSLSRFMMARTTGIIKLFPGIWGFVWSTNVSSAIRISSRELDVMLIGAMLGSSAVALYRVAKQFSQVILKVIDPLYQSIYPDLARLYADGALRHFVQFCLRSSALAAAFASVVWIVFYFSGEYLIRWTMGDDYIGATAVMSWYMAAVVVAAIGFPLQPAMLSMGRPHHTLWIHVVSSVAYFGALYLLLAAVGMIGAGIAYLIYYVIWTALMLWVEAVVIYGALSTAPRTDR